MPVGGGFIVTQCFVCICAALQMDLNDVPRSGMEYERGIVVLANPYSEDASRKFTGVEVVYPATGTVKYLCKLPQSLFMPGTVDRLLSLWSWSILNFWQFVLFVVLHIGSQQSVGRSGLTTSAALTSLPHLPPLCLRAWLSGRTSVFGRRTFSVLRSTYSWRVTTYVGKPSAMGQPTRLTQPFIPSGSIDE